MFGSVAVLDIQRIPGLPTGFFNAAAWPAFDRYGAPTLLLGRNVEARGEPGKPDVGSLALAVLVDGKAESITEVWTPEEGGVDLLEDPRVTVLPDGEIFIGFTRLCPNGKGYDALPAYSLTTTELLVSGVFPDTHHITNPDQGAEKPYLPPGKNATPLVSRNILYRQDDANHEFVVCSLNDGRAEEIQHVKLPTDLIPKWGEWKIGSAMPPIWLNANEAIFMMHGISMDNGRYRYSIGSARLFLDDNGIYTIDNVSSEPHLTPESFKRLFPGEDIELRPEERQAVYLCGGITLFDAQGNPALIKAYPNVGDTRTVEVTFSVAEIIKGWDRSAPKA